MAESRLYQKIEDFLKNTELKSAEKKELVLGVVGNALVENAAANGIDIRGFSHSLDSFFVNHALNNHGYEKLEEQRGNVHITIEDIKNIPEVLQTPDFIIYSSKTKVGNKAIVFVKNIKDSTIFVEEVRKGRMRLAAQTLYKLPQDVRCIIHKRCPRTLRP